MDFSEDDPWKKDDPDPDASDLLNFCSRAQTLISQLLLLSNRIPPEFRDRRYDPVLFDLRYFDSPDDFEARIEGDAGLEELEDELRESCAEFMERFFLLANGVVFYHQELFKSLNDLQEGVHVRNTLEKLMENENGRQLLTESIVLFGCLLLLLEHCMGGTLREKLLVAHVRHDRCFDAPNLDKICLLCRAHLSTSIPVGQVHLSSMVLIQKPDELFASFPFPKLVVDTVICRLRDDDLYNQLRHYPDPEHRTVALGAQDLSFSWDAYKVAKTSLLSSLSPPFIRDLSQFHCNKVKDFLLELDSLLLDGIITRDYVLSNSQSLLSLVRNCNVSLRWLVLHRSSIDKKLREIVISAGTIHQVEEEMLLSLLLKTSQLEFVLKQLYIELLEGKAALWLESRNIASNCMLELSEYYNGSQALSWKVKDASLKDWFLKLSEEVCSLDHMKTGTAGRKLYNVISALREIESFQEVEENLQIKRRLFGIQKHLQDMLKALGLHNDTLFAFSVITDAVYACEFVGCFDQILFKMIEKDLSMMLNLHSFFLKFRSMLDKPLDRVSQNHSLDLLSVSNYYSSEYVSRICKILRIMPVMLFRILNNDVVSNLQPCHVPNRIEREKFQDFMQLDQQFHLAKAVNNISVISQGFQIISRSFHGLINLDMKNWLEKVVREEFSVRFRKKLNSFLLSPNVGLEELEASVQSITKYVLSQLGLMELCQDLIHIQGHRIWEEEFLHILRHCAREEHNDYVRKRQEDPVVRPVQSSDFSNAKTFLGQLLHQILRLSNPSCSMYIEPMCGWFDAEGHELLGLRFFDLLESCIGPVGMTCMDSLLSFLITENLEHSLRVLNNLLDSRCLEELRTLDNDLGHATSLPLLGCSPYKQMAKLIDIAWEPWVECLAHIGQLQLLRCLISSKLKSACKVKAGVVSFAVEGMMSSISSRREKTILQSVVDRKVKNEDDATIEHFLQKLTRQGTICGFCSTFQTVYISNDPPPFLGRCASIMSISQLSRYVLDTHLGTLTSRLKKVVLDFSPVVIGIGTFLRQFNTTYTTQYVQYIGQYIRTATVAAFGTLYEPQKGSLDPSSDVLKSAFWLMYFCKYMGVSKDLLDSCLPPPLLALLQT
ncbi:hypothetical protein AAC387_Pa02g3782 [Persea americana]